MAGRGRYGRGGAAGPPRKAAQGMFKDNVWHCDCDPPLPAEHFKVKKESKNQGRWFYTCQQSEPKRCGFFLWDEDAKPREAAVVLANGHGEASSAQMNAGVSLENRRNEADNAQFTTPKKPINTGVYATPSTTTATKRKLPWQEPIDLEADSFSDESPTKHIKLDTTSSKQATVSPVSHSNTCLAAEILECLSTVTVPPTVTAQIRSIANRHDLKTQGIIKGRDISRLALKAKDAKIVELESRIASLEASRDFDRGIIKRLEWQHENDVLDDEATLDGS